MRLRRIARIVVRRAAEEMLRVVGASVVAEVVQAADPVQLLGMSQPLQILRNLVVLGERSEEHTSELQSLMRISYAVFCLHKKQQNNTTMTTNNIYAKLL